MEHLNLIFDIDRLRKIEAACRQHLTSEPDDTHIRSVLACCLFMQALHQAGRENLLKAIVETIEKQDKQGDSRYNVVLNRDACELLTECLRQTATVKHVSMSPLDKAEVESLQSMVRLFGGEPILREAEEEVARYMDRLIRAIHVERKPVEV